MTENNKYSYKLSIITINFNNLQGLKRTVESVINQTWREFEYIIIDGGSTDGSVEYISQMQNHFAYWVSEADKGIYHAMNKGIKVANGEYLLFLNSGDYMLEKNVIMEVFKKGIVEDIIYCNIRFIYTEKEVNHEFPDQIDLQYFIDRSIGHPSSFINAKLFKTLGLYDEELKIVSDWKFFIKARSNPDITFRKFNIFLTAFGMDGISNLNKNLGKNERQMVLNKNYPYLLRLRKFENIKLNWEKSKRIQLLLNLGFLKNIFR